MSVVIKLPKGAYSNNKERFTKLRQKYGVVQWIGTGWVGNKSSLEATFYMGLIKSGITPKYEGDILVASGDSKFITAISKLGKQVGGSVKKKIKPVSSVFGTKTQKIKGELKIEKFKLQQAGMMNVRAQEKWLKLHKEYLKGIY